MAKRRLEEVVHQIPRPMWINVELRSYKTAADGLELRVVDLVHHMNMVSRVVFSSFNPLTLARAGRLAPEVPRAILARPRQAILLQRAWLGRLVRYETRRAEIAQVSAKMVGKCHRAGRVVRVWVTNAPERIKDMAGLGVDGVLTDVPDVALSHLGKDSRAMGHVAV